MITGSQPLHLELLGSPNIRLGKHLLTGFATTKAQALLIYLAVTQRVHSRDALASLFWRDMPDRQAKKNLRNILPNLRVLVGPYLVITRHSVAFNRERPYHLDVEVFRSALTANPSTSNLQTLHDALALFQDDFLVGFHVRAAPAFEEWVLMEREHLRALAIDGLLLLAEQYITQDAYDLGLQITRRLLTLDPWRETVHQYHMRLLAYTGQRTAALEQYASCRTILADEFDVEPLAETTALYKQIKSGALETHRATSTLWSQSPCGDQQVDWTEFPRRTPLYGRHDELACLYRWLTVDDVSLVGLFGLSGQGKTALVAELAWRLVKGELPLHTSARFTRIIWHSLLTPSPFTTVLHRWLHFLSDYQGWVPEQVDEQLAVLFDHLHQQRCLLILDNIERLLDDDAPDGRLRPGYEAYEQMIRQISHQVHRSCLVLISQERPQYFPAYEGETTGVQALHLRGLSQQAGTHLLHAEGIVGDEEAMAALVTQYSGHPLALKLAAATVHEFFAKDLNAFIIDAQLILEDIRHLLDQQCAKLSPLEKEIMIYLAMVREPMSFQLLWNQLSSRPARRAVLEALRTLQRRSLIETWEDGFGLQNMMREYIITYWVDAVY